MDLNYRVTNLFPVSIHEFSVDGFGDIKSELIDYAYDLKDQDPDGNKISNVGGWQSKGFNVRNEDVLQNFLGRSITQIQNIRCGVEINIYAWVNINQTTNYNMKHNHPWSDLSGVLWIKTPDNCGKLTFESPYNFTGNKEICAYTGEYKHRTNSFLTYFYEPYEGGMLIFPSHLTHWVQPNESEEDRISVSFNITLSNVEPEA